MLKDDFLKLINETEFDENVILDKGLKIELLYSILSSYNSSIEKEYTQVEITEVLGDIIHNEI